VGSAPSSLTAEQITELKAKDDELVERAAATIAEADVLLVATGAGCPPTAASPCTRTWPT